MKLILISAVIALFAGSSNWYAMKQRGTANFGTVFLSYLAFFVLSIFILKYLI